MLIFVSYVSEDRDLARRLAAELEELAEVRYWDRSAIPGKQDWDMIESWIEDADLVIVLVTRHTMVRSMSVAQEVGMARSHGKTIIPLMERGVEASKLGCLQGTTYQAFEADNLEAALSDLVEAVRHWRSEQRWAAFGGLLIAGGLLYAASRGKGGGQ